MLKRNKKAAEAIKTLKSLAKLNNENLDIIRIGDLIFIDPSNYSRSNNKDYSEINFTQFAKNNSYVIVPSKQTTKIINLMEGRRGILILKPRENKFRKRNDE